MRDRWGPPEVVRVRDVETPTPNADQVLVRVKAASVNRADIDNLYPRWKFLRLFLGLRAPRDQRIGLDIAGVVEAVGPDAVRFKPGDEVFGELSEYGQGAFAEYVCPPEEAFATKPVEMTFEEAATLPHSATLAIQALRTRRGRTVARGGKVLIVGASGNVGPFAVQVAKSLGADVTGVARTDKLEFVRSLGADHVIDYTKVDYTLLEERYDWIVDVDAHHPVRRWRRALNTKGVYAALGGSATWFLTALVQGPVISLATRRQIGVMLWWKPFNPPDVETLKSLISAGKVRPAIDRVYPLSEVVQALRYVDDRHNRGKVVIRPT